jgi:predicted nucleic acid-binding protein
LIFVDSNIPMYLIGADVSRRLDVQRVVERLTGEKHNLVTSSEVFQEILHRYVSTNRRDRIEPAFETLRGIVDDVRAVEEADVLAGKGLVHAHPRLSARDAVHAAVMRRCQIAEILTFDGGFDELSGIARLPVR